MFNSFRGLFDSFEGIPSDRVINSNLRPSVPSGSPTLTRNVKSGKFVWDRSKIRLATYSGGEPFLQPGERLLNAAVMSQILFNEHLIPEEWKGNVVVFWGTRFTYYGSDGSSSHYWALKEDSGKWRQIEVGYFDLHGKKNVFVPVYNFQ